MTDTDPGRGSGGRSSSKVARLIEAYDLGSSFGAHLEARWTAEGDDRLSLRDLADRFNRELLRSALEDAGESPIDGEVENLYRLLTDDEVSSGVQTEASARLERTGVDVDQLERDFVTYQAIRSYLTKYRDAEYSEPSDEDRPEKVRQTVQRLQSRTQSVTERSLGQLREADHLTLGEFRLFVDVDVLCEDCGAQYGVAELLERGGCDCDADT
ncbi:rod-determining factor RdfA [Halomarina rubra]|uniref:Rod-determining factor RdfA n=1 Tax=Halomarina rubra TaxID=2071873 RepID=A0ABD6AWR8_9EURY|nr:rod-determining factor RdfA [Halomarina rubra]